MSNMQTDKTSLTESVSTLMDNEHTHPDSAVRNIKDDPELTRQWESFHIIRDTLNDDLSSKLSIEFSDRVMAALETEPVYMTPRRMNKNWQQNAFLKPAVGFAIAATIAAVSVLSWQSFFGHQADSPTMLVVNDISGLNQSNVMSVSHHAHTDEDTSNKMRWEGSQEELQELLNDYLMNHTERSAQGNMHGIMPYARLVGFDGNHQ